MIMQCRQSFLFCEGQPWSKKDSSNFDVPMGSYDGAEISELVGLYLLHRLTNGKEAIFEKKDIGLYRDDGIELIKLNQSGRTSERVIKPKIIKLFKSELLDITVEPASQVTDFFFRCKVQPRYPYP